MIEVLYKEYGESKQFLKTSKFLVRAILGIPFLSFYNKKTLCNEY